jgi:hypothetical protein
MNPDIETAILFTANFVAGGGMYDTGNRNQDGTSDSYF